MHTLALAPYFHPTTVCFVDDNEPFLNSVRLELPDDLAYRMFTSPAAALDFLDVEPPLAPLADRCFSIQRATDGRGNRAIIHLDLDLIEQEINHHQRFQRVSVVVVDYAMPAMNGLDFCNALTAPDVKRALLTGAADEKLAVQAFNAGLIHRFIPKQQPDPVEAILANVRELQHAYFEQHAARLLTALAMDPPGFLVDQKVADHVAQLMREQHLVEYYLVDDPPGLLLLNGDGQAQRLVILGPQQLQAQARCAAAYHAPAEAQRALQEGQAVGAFAGDAPAGYFGPEHYPWAEHLSVAQRLGDSGQWYVGRFENAPLDIDFDPGSSSYNAYLATLDRTR